MAHDPESEVIAYLAGGMGAEQRAAFSDHLVDCERCWQELQAVQHGRRLAEGSREVASVEMRDRVRALVLAEERAQQAPPRRLLSVGGRRGARRRIGDDRPWPTSRRLALASAVAVVPVLLVVELGMSRGGVARHGVGAADPRALVAAVADYRGHVLPGRELPTTGAPDLSRLKLLPVGGAGGDYDGLAVDGYAYQDSAGRRLVVYLSKQPFPTAVGARRLQGPDGPWTAQRADVTILCARAPHALLVVAQDGKLVRDVAAQLGVL